MFGLNDQVRDWPGETENVIKEEFKERQRFRLTFKIILD